MNKDDLLQLAIVLVTLVTGAIIGVGCQRDLMSAQAIAHHAATYVIIDPSSGLTQFKWNDEVAAEKASAK
jgi:hypothetical protein